MGKIKPYLNFSNNNIAKQIQIKKRFIRENYFTFNGGPNIPFKLKNVVSHDY